MPSFAWPSLLVAVPLFLGGTAPVERLPLPPPRDGIVFSGDTNEVTLGYLLDELARATGQELALSSADREELVRAKISLAHLDQVPAGEVYAFVESFLAQEGVVIAPLKGGARPVLAVYLPGGGRRGSPLNPEPLPISQAHFDEAAEHPALFIRTHLVLKHTDTRQLQTQLRQVLVDPTGIQNVVPAGERGLLLQGRAKFIVGLARQILELDEAFGRGEPAKLPTLEATEGGR